MSLKYCYLELLHPNPDPSCPCPFMMGLPGKIGQKWAGEGHSLPLFSLVQRSQEIAEALKVKAGACLPIMRPFWVFLSTLLFSLRGRLGSDGSGVRGTDGQKEILP